MAARHCYLWQRWQSDTFVSDSHKVMTGLIVVEVSLQFHRYVCPCVTWQMLTWNRWVGSSQGVENDASSVSSHHRESNDCISCCSLYGTTTLASFVGWWMRTWGWFWIHWWWCDTALGSDCSCQQCTGNCDNATGGVWFSFWSKSLLGLLYLL